MRFIRYNRVSALRRPACPRRTFVTRPTSHSAFDAVRISGRSPPSSRRSIPRTLDTGSGLPTSRDARVRACISARRPRAPSEVENVSKYFESPGDEETNPRDPPRRASTRNPVRSPLAASEKRTENGGRYGRDRRIDRFFRVRKQTNTRSTATRWSVEVCRNVRHGHVYST